MAAPALEEEAHGKAGDDGDDHRQHPIGGPVLVSQRGQPWPESPPCSPSGRVQFLAHHLAVLDHREADLVGRRA